MLNDEVLFTIELAALEAVTGGRIDAGPQTASPDVTKALAQCTQSFQQGCQQIAQAKQAGDQGMQQVLGQVMQQKMGGGGGHEHG